MENIRQEIIGIFDGENMVDEQGRIFPVPANYASKSKLVEGDALKLTLTEDGQLIYKQVGPTHRRTAFGRIQFIENQLCTVVLQDGSRYKILKASASYFRLNEGDEVMVQIPNNLRAEWAALEGVISHSIDAQ
jgi:antitoxin component of MazEF toxin-antitoxin module